MPPLELLLEVEVLAVVVPPELLVEAPVEVEPPVEDDALEVPVEDELDVERWMLPLVEPAEACVPLLEVAPVLVEAEVPVVGAVEPEADLEVELDPLVPAELDPLAVLVGELEPPLVVVELEAVPLHATRERRGRSRARRFMAADLTARDFLAPTRARIRVGTSQMGRKAWAPEILRASKKRRAACTWSGKAKMLSSPCVPKMRPRSLVS